MRSKQVTGEVLGNRAAFSFNVLEKMSILFKNDEHLTALKVDVAFGFLSNSFKHKNTHNVTFPVALIYLFLKLSPSLIFFVMCLPVMS